MDRNKITDNGSLQEGKLDTDEQLTVRPLYIQKLLLNHVNNSQSSLYLLTNIFVERSVTLNAIDKNYERLYPKESEWTTLI